MDDDSDLDLGLFGPDTVTWRVHAHPLSLVGGLRALLLQALHPEAMRLLHATSNFQQNPWSRLQRTAQYVATVTFGPTPQALAAADRVRGVHQRLGIDDPGQLAWVHACEVDSFLAAASACGAALSDEDTDRYLAEQVRLATLVGVPESLAPHSTDELRGYFRQMRPRLALTPEARDAARVVLAPPRPVPLRYALPFRLAWTTLSSIAVGLLPGWARRLYRLPPLPGSGLVAGAGLRSLSAVVATLPPQWREGPAYRDAKARAALLAS